MKYLLLIESDGAYIHSDEFESLEIVGEYLQDFLIQEGDSHDRLTFTLDRISEQ